MSAKKKKKKKNEELWSKIRDLIRSINKNSNGYDEIYIKIKFNSDCKLPLNKTIEIPRMIIVVRAAFHENNKYYAQVLNNKNMLYYHSINVSEGIDVNKASA